MKAVVWTDYGRIELQEVPKPEVGPLEVLVKVKASSLCTTDTVMIDRGILGLRPPVIIGHEVSGIVDSVGGGVHELRPGDRIVLEPPVPCRKCAVCSRGFTHLCPNTLHIGAHTPGGLAEYLTIDYRNAHRIAQSVSLPEAALAEPVAVCLEALDRAGGVRGKSVAVFGDGPFGVMLCKLAVLFEATTVIAIGHHEGRLRRASRFGAVTVNSRDTDPVTATRKLTAEMGADVVIEAIGSAEIVAGQCLPMLAPRGTVVLFSDLREKVLFDMHSLHLREQAVVGSARSLGKFGEAVRLIEEGSITIKELITHTLPLHEVQEGFRLIRRDKENAMKVVITFG